MLKKKNNKKAEKAEEARKCPCAKALKLLIGILFPVVGILFVVYFWNLDQKLMTTLYKIVNEVFDEKKVDLNF